MNVFEFLCILCGSRDVLSPYPPGLGEDLDPQGAGFGSSGDFFHRLLERRILAFSIRCTL